jgi:hypothetical protein
MKKNAKFTLVEDMNLTSTGGPLIPKGTQGQVLIRRRDGRFWVNIFQFGRRHLNSWDSRIRENI